MSTIQSIGLGAAANDKTGDTLRDAGGKINQNFANLNADKAEKTNVLEKNNTTAFTPSANYHPATKKYVDDLAAGLVGRTVTEAITLALTDAGGAVVIDSIDDIAVTIPPASEVNFPLWTRITLAKTGLGNGVYVAGEGVTMTGNPATATGKWATAMKVAADTWVLSGEEHVLTWVDLLAGLKADENYEEIKISTQSYDDGKIVITAYDVLQDTVVLLLSGDNGETWDDITPQYGAGEGYEYFGINGTNIFCVAYEEVGGEKLLLSTDQGETWEDITPDTGASFTGIYVSGTKIVCTTSIQIEEDYVEKIFVSINLSTTWANITPEFGVNGFIFAFDGDSIVLSTEIDTGDGFSRRLFISTNLGISWENISIEGVISYEDLFLKENTILMRIHNGENNYIWFSQDYGATWGDITPTVVGYVRLPSQSGNNILFFLSDEIGVKLLMSIDSGETWEEQVANIDSSYVLLQANTFSEYITCAYID
jgi:hypothetical protein